MKKQTGKQEKQFAWLAEPALARLFDIFPKGALRAVGGAVRNSLLSLPITDIDLATTLPPDAVLKLAKKHKIKAIETALDHGTVTLVVDKGALEQTTFEVTTLRKDVETDGRHAMVAFTDSWAEDAARRDFTINGLYVDDQGQIYDPAGGGLKDIKQSPPIIRFIGDPKERIREDYLRILRFFRFSAQYGGAVLEPKGLAACKSLASHLLKLSKERIWQEFAKILTAPHALPILKQMEKGKILQALFSQNADLKRLEQLIKGELSLCLEFDPVRRLGALFVSQMSDVKSLGDGLRLSRKEEKRLKIWLETGDGFLPEHLSDLISDEDNIPVLLYLYGQQGSEDYLLAHFAKEKTLPSKEDMQKFYQKLSRQAIPRLPIKGEDLIALGHKPGKELGKTLKTLEAAWLKAKTKLSKIELLTL